MSSRRESPLFFISDQCNSIIDFFPPAYHKAVPGGQNVNHIALTLQNTAAQIEAYLKERGIDIVREMTGNFGAQGDSAHAFHVFDPDGNLLELHRVNRADS